jgi:hypothetical protein
MVMLVASCATTMAGTWRAPNFNGAPLRKVLVCALTPNDVNRRIIEDQFVRGLQPDGVVGIQSYTVLPPGQPSEQTIRQAVATTGADGVVVTKVTNVEDVPFYGTGPGYYWGPYYAAFPPEWASVYAPGYLQSQTEVTLLTRAYSVQQGGELVWFGSSQTFDPASVQGLMSSVVPKVVDSMVKAGILPSSRAQPAVGETL